MTPTQPAEAASASLFNPGYIITDANFFTKNAMSEAQIQAFLEARAPGACGPNSCLKQFRMDTTNKPQYYSDTAGSVECTAYPGALGESAARIIYKVQQACGISAKVLLVTLQKERGLVEKTHPIPNDWLVSMGYGCPDTAACDRDYFGFFNQVWNAARQFKVYRAAPNYFNFRAGVTRNIQFHPNAACGSAPVYISNAATAALYNYTPYQPNVSALANLYGTGDTCGSYGNRNFWVFYTDWFGPTGAPVKLTPTGDLNSITPKPGGVDIRGWAFDPETKDSILVDVWVDGAWKASLKADKSRPDVQAAFPGQSANHGFVDSLTLPAGSRNVCVYAINIGGGGSHPLLGCRTVAVPPAPAGQPDPTPIPTPDPAPRPDRGLAPVGDVNAVSVSGNTVTVRGWAFDPDTSESILVDVWAGGAWKASLTADKSRPDVKAAYPAQSASHGFSGSITVANGTQNICVYGINTGRGSHTLLECRTVTVGTPPPSAGGPAVPRGDVNAMTLSGHTLSIRGWTFDPDTRASIVADVWVNGAWKASLNANQSRPDVKAAYPAQTANHGFSGSITLAPGSNRVCVYGINDFTGGVNPVLQCRTITIPVAGVAAPIGDVNAMSLSGNSLALRGWAFDPDTTAPILVDVWANGKWKASLTADQARPDVKAAYPRQSANHGFAGTISLASGANRVCVYGINDRPGVNPLIQCRDIRVP